MEPKAERTRRHIIEKSASLFNRKGYHGTSMSDILAVTGLAKGGIYGHFKGKDEIAAAAFDHAFYQIMDTLALRVKRQTGAIEKLEAIIDFYKDFDESAQTEGGCPILSFSGHSLEDMPEIAKLVARATRVMLDSLVRIIQKGQKYDQIRTDIDPEAYAEIVYSRIEGALALAKAIDDRQRLHRILDALARDLRRDLVP